MSAPGKISAWHDSLERIKVVLQAKIAEEKVRYLYAPPPLMQVHMNAIELLTLDIMRVDDQIEEIKRRIRMMEDDRVGRG